jgi:2,3-dihydroxybenzoate-AMP ligase
MLEGVVGWPPAFAQRYRARGYWAGTTLGQAFDRSVGAHADRVAVVDGTRRLTYRELSRLVDRVAVHLALRGIRGGQRVVFQLPNTAELVIAYVACLKVGAIPVCCLPAHRHAEIAHLARFTEAAAWLIPSDLRGFDYVAMAEELRGSLPALREIIVAGERAGGRMTLLDDLLRDPAEERTAPGSLGRLRPRPDDVAVFQLSGGALCQHLLGKWYPAALDMFGRSDSPNAPKFIRWGLKNVGNAEIREAYTQYVDRKLEALGLEPPDERLNRRFL